MTLAIDIKFMHTDHGASTKKMRDVAAVLGGTTEE